ncbi:MAG TPA: tetratricopeptide repeat protein [Candidatus Limnocylindrales bacterium]|nr:tetratricopeptide repeat protein [Candidatus Limnocylindrales bacterium]
MRERFVLLAAALAAFGASLGSGFHFDDYAILADAGLRSASGWRQIWTLRQTRPLTYLSFWFNYRLGAENPLGYHALNLLLHGAAVLLLYEVLRRLAPARVALVAALIFAVHPLQAESVDYVWGRSIVLAAVFCFGALLAWLSDRPWLATGLFALALLAKEECAAFPLVLLLLPKARVRRAPVAAMLGLAALAAARVFYALAVIPGAPAGVQAGITPWHYFLAEGPAIWRYLRLLAIPYGFTVDPEIGVPAAWLALAAWAALGAAAWFTRRWRWFAIGLLLLLPSSSIFPAADLAADRRMYLPMLGFATAVALLLVRWKPAGAAAVVVLCGVSIARTQVWNHDAALWREAVERGPDKVRPKIQLSRDVPAKEALRLLADARALSPNDPAIATEAGKVLLANGRAAEALAEFGRALALDPRNPENYNNRGVALAALGQTDAARADFLRALAMDGGLEEARENLRKMGGR